MSGTHAHYSVRTNFHPPPAEFEGCFTTFYSMTLEIEGGRKLVDYLLPEWANIRFWADEAPVAAMGKGEVNKARFTATGPSSLPCRFELGPSRMWAVGFLPLGWARLIGSDARDLANVICDGSTHPAFAKFDPLTDGLFQDGLGEQEQLEMFIQFMRDQMQPNRDEPKIMRVHRALVDTSLVTVEQLADASGMSIRTLERVSRRYFGFTPKLLMRRQRFMRSLTDWMLHPDKRWTEAMDGHYHDQAQFTREFHQFMTMNPSEYAALDHPILASFMEARARVWGSAAQTLDKPRK